MLEVFRIFWVQNSINYLVYTFVSPLLVWLFMLLLIDSLKAYDEEPSFIIKFVKNVFKDSLTDEEMNELLKQL